MRLFLLPVFVLTFFISDLTYGVILQVRSSPSGANVLIDDRESIKTPVTIKLDSGYYNLEIMKDGYKIFTDKIVLTGDLEVFARLTPTNSHFTFARQIISGSQPKDVIYSPDGRYLMITPMDASYIQVYDTMTAALSNICIPFYGSLKGFIEGVFNSDGSEYWFTQMNEHGRVFVMSMSNLTIKTNIPTYGNWTKVGEFTPDFKYYYVSNWLSRDITIINAETYSYSGRFRTFGDAPRGIGFSDDCKFIYAVMFDSGEIIKYSVEEGYKVVSRVKTGGSNGRFRIDRNKEVAYINNMHIHKLFVYDMKTDKIIKTLKVWDHPDNVRLSPDDRFLYVSSRGPNNKKGYTLRSPFDGRITVFDTERDYMKIEDLYVGNQPIGLAISPDGKTLAISNFKDDTIEFYNINL
jgi:DNA-binding beta-propeller fold protein YncE